MVYISLLLLLCMPWLLQVAFDSVDMMWLIVLPKLEGNINQTKC